uniref:Dynein regulatory complex subunit 3 n=1 Tax=Tetraodon nigroviridis TaxID=99883 RepID=H3C599_TETNG
MAVDCLKQKAVNQINDEQALKIANEDGIQYSDVHILELDFKDTIKIDSLWDFTSLVKLYLNNNLIEKIEGLEYLRNLKWLNLSSNKIKKIEGLDNLQELEMLLLAKNQISVIENMETLENLTLFNIAHNCIEQKDNVFYLRKFKKLFTLCLFGNPAFQDEDYASEIKENFPKLKNPRLQALSGLISKHRQQCLGCVNISCRKVENKSPVFVQHDFLTGSRLFDAMVGNDVGTEMLQSLPRAAPRLQTFKDQVSQLCSQLFETGLAEHKQRETEVNLFYSAQRQMLGNEQEAISDILTTFAETHEKRMEELQKLEDPEHLTVEISNFNNDINEFHKDLITREVELLNGLEDMMDLFETNILNMVDSFVVTVKSQTFSHCQDLENSYYEKICEDAQATIENMATGKQEVDMSEEAKRLFADRETVMDTLATNHKNHLQKIRDSETQLIEGLQAWKLDLLKEIKDKHINQHYFRKSCIYACTKDFKDQLEELQ